LGVSIAIASTCRTMFGGLSVKDADGSISSSVKEEATSTTSGFSFLNNSAEAGSSLPPAPSAAELPSAAAPAYTPSGFGFMHHNDATASKQDHHENAPQDDVLHDMSDPTPPPPQSSGTSGFSFMSSPTAAGGGDIGVSSSIAAEHLLEPAGATNPPASTETSSFSFMNSTAPAPSMATAQDLPQLTEDAIIAAAPSPAQSSGFDFVNAAVPAPQAESRDSLALPKNDSIQDNMSEVSDISEFTSQAPMSMMSMGTPGASTIPSMDMPQVMPVRPAASKPVAAAGIKFEGAVMPKKTITKKRRAKKVGLGAVAVPSPNHGGNKAAAAPPETPSRVTTASELPQPPPSTQASSSSLPPIHPSSSHQPHAHSHLPQAAQDHSNADANVTSSAQQAAARADQFMRDKMASAANKEHPQAA
jgi:hypothetical protein